ncbi:MAG TPA: DUF2142 domain-containing protein [Acidimicrobiia bacterium]|nr:DUF2142 domain-containing protein [Acidimicrobiia bacterium]
MVRGEFSGVDEDTAFGVLSRVDGPRWPALLDPVCFIAHPNVTPYCVVEPVVAPSGSFLIYMGAYSPWYFLIEGVPTLALSGKPVVYLMRFMSAAMCAALIASALVSAQRLGRWAVVGTMFALTPMVFYLGGAVNPNGVEITSAIAIWSSVAALVPVLVTVFAAGQIWAVLAAARRYAVGEDGAYLYLTNPDWTPPLPPVLGVVVMVVAIAALAWRAATVPVDDEAGPSALKGAVADPASVAPAALARGDVGDT